MHLIFSHIPKTAGVSLYGELKRHMPAISFGSRESLQRLEQMTLADLAGYRLLSGHVPLPRWRELGVRGPAFTVLRDPLDRMESVYRYLQASQHPDHQQRKFSSFGEFLAEAQASGRNTDQQCRMLSAAGKAQAVAQQADAAKLLPVPLTQLPDFLARLSLATGIDLQERRANVSTGARVQLTDEERRLLELLTVQDRQLCALATEHYPRWAEQWFGQWSRFLPGLRRRARPAAGTAGPQAPGESAP